MTLDELTEKLKSRTGGKPLLKVTVKELTKSGRPGTIVMETVSGIKVQVSGRDFVKAFDLKTALFTIQQEDRLLAIEGRGYGHGVGLCQYGTVKMAQRGSLCQQILAHYFPQSVLQPVYGGKRFNP